MAKLQEEVSPLESTDIRKPLIVVGIPAYNEERNIAKIILRAQRFGDIVIVCDDGSTDMTAEISERLGTVVVRHNENAGYGAAIQSIFEKAKKLNCDILVTLDGDGQHCVDDISRIVEPILSHEADIVVGSRFAGKTQNGDKHIPWHRQLGIKAITLLTKSASKCNISDAQNGFRAYNKKALETLTLGENGMGVSVEILVKAEEQGLRLTESPVACDYKNVEHPSTQNPLIHGTSVVMSLVRLIAERHRLLFLGVPGIISLFIGVLFGVWVLQIYAIERSIVTNIALASVAFVMIGIFTLFTSITLYAISRMTNRKVN